MAVTNMTTCIVAAVVAFMVGGSLGFLTAAIFAAGRDQ
jgi:hypothetical protein